MRVELILFDVVGKSVHARVLLRGFFLGWQGAILYCGHKLFFCFYANNWHLLYCGHSVLNSTFECFAAVQKGRSIFDWRKVIYLSRLASSIIRRTKSATLIPSRLASTCSHFICGSVKSIDRFMGVIHSTLLEPCQGVL